MDQLEPDRPPVRASDGDRQRVAEVLRRHTTEGRLTIEEYEQRVDAAYAARTIAELRPLLADLPVRFDEVLPAYAAPAVSHERPRDRSDAWPRYVLIVVAAVLVVGAVAAATRGVFAFWPLFLIGIFVFGGGSGGRRRHR